MTTGPDETAPEQQDTRSNFRGDAQTPGWRGGHGPAGRPLVIGVAGGTGAGKTTVVRAIVEAVGADQVAQLPEDAYYREYRHLSEADRARINWDHPDAIEVDLLLQHLKTLLAGGSVERPVYDFTAYARAAETVRVEPRPVLIVEGILVYVEARLRELFDVKVFVDTDADLRLIRRVLRDVNERGRSLDSVVAQYLATVRPMHLAFVEPSKRHADIIVPEGGANRVAIDLLRSAILHSVGSYRQREQP
jgi:uridine kinase